MGCTVSSEVKPSSHEVILDLEAIGKAIKDKTLLDSLSSLGVQDLYVDQEFSGLDALYLAHYDYSYAGRQIQWKRPAELTNNPQLFVDGASRLDIVQGDLGDCWFLCSCAAVTMKEQILNKIIPADNRLFNAKGLYHFCFWRFGEWVDVYVDDLLPTCNEELMYAQATDPNEIWPSLIEKAYAKLNGCYEALSSGKACEALLDLTGGLTEVYYPSQDPTPDLQLFHIIQQAIERDAFIACNTDKEHEGNKGLITGHAYSVTKASKVLLQNGDEHHLLRIFNPWGNIEWTGDWSDESSRWQEVPEPVRNQLGQTNRLDGEFWMSFGDFCQQFARMYICTLGPDFDLDGYVDKNKMYSFHGQWIAGLSAGGCSDNLSTYHINPQYRFLISSGGVLGRIDPNQDKIEPCYLIVSIMQKFERATRKANPSLCEEHINFRLYRVKGYYKGRLPLKFFEDVTWIDPVVGDQDYTNTREVTCRYLLDPGEYVVVPSTFDARVEASYLLRLYAWTTEFECWEAKDKKGCSSKK